MGISNKIIIIAPLVPPVDSKSGGRIHLISKALVESGKVVEVISLVASPIDVYFYSLDNVVYKFFDVTSKTNINIARKIISRFKIFLIVFLICAFKIQRKTSVLFFPNCDFRLLLMILCRIRGLKVVMEINEYPLVGKKNGLIKNLQQYVIINFSFKLCNSFVVISESLMQLVLKFGARNVRVVKIPVIALPVTSSSDIRQSPFHEKYILHAGTLSEQKDGITGILQCISILNKRYNLPVKMVFTGSLDNSPDKIVITKAIENYGLNDKIIFLGYLSTIDLDWYMRNASAAIVNKNDNIQNRYCFATKICEYLSYGTPLITTNCGEASRYLSNGINSYLTAPGDIEGLVDITYRILTESIDIVSLKVEEIRLFKMRFEYSNYIKDLSVFF